jgi:putative NIF3 family GTP cyclohydrolase 1 type 2
MALGHHNSEKPGIMALAEWLKKRFKIPVEFKDIPNPA